MPLIRAITRAKARAHASKAAVAICPIVNSRDPPASGLKKRWYESLASVVGYVRPDESAGEDPGENVRIWDLKRDAEMRARSEEIGESPSR